MKLLKEIPLDLIDEPNTPVRSYMVRETLEELSESIKRFGLIEPIVVKVKGDRYELIAGHRRLLAAKMAGMVDIPCFIDDGHVVDADLIRLEENIVRDDVSYIDQAKYIKLLMEKRGLSQSDIARQMKKSPTFVNKMLRLLESDDVTQAAVDAGKLSYHAAIELQRVDDPVVKQHLTESAIRGGATTQVVSNWVHNYEAQKEAIKRREEGAPHGEPLAPPPVTTIKCPCCGLRYKEYEIINAIMCSFCFRDFTTLQNVIKAQGYFQGKGEEDEQRISQTTGLRDDSDSPV